MLSVIIPCYNQCRFLPAAVNSIIQNGYEPVEIIVVNDGSTDDTRRVAKGFGNAVCYIEQPNAGLSAARNAGLANARGEFIQFLDADDVLQPGKLALHADFLRRHPDVGIVYCEGRYFTDGCESEHRLGLRRNCAWMPLVEGHGTNVLPCLVAANIMPVNAPLIRSAVVSSVGFFDTRLNSLEDWDYWLRCAIHGVNFRVFDVEGKRALIRVSDGSMSQHHSRMKRAESQVRKKLAGLLEDQKLRHLNTRRTMQLMGDESFGAFERAKIAWRLFCNHEDVGRANIVKHFFRRNCC